MEQAERDYYEMLGLERGAGAGEIKRAYRARARELHPDVSSDPEAAERFAEVARAYRVLSHRTARLLYDRFGYAGDLGFDDARFTPGRDGGAPATADVRVDELEAQIGTRRTVRIEEPAPCSTCGGRGLAAGAASTGCDRCGGDGRVRTYSWLGESQLLQIETCPACGGTGEAPRDACDACAGTGAVVAERTLEVAVPAGARDGDAWEQDGVRVVVHVVPFRDSRVVRALAAVALVCAVALLVFLLVAPPQAL